MLTHLTLDQAIRLLQEASAVIVDESVVTFASVEEMEEPFMTLSWEADEGFFEYDFYGCDNEEVQFAGGSLWLVPTNQQSETEEPIHITLLGPMDLERITKDMIAIDKQDNP